MRIASCIYALTGIGLTFLPGLLRGSSSHKTCLSAASNKSLAEARAMEAPEENTPSERLTRRSQLAGMCQRRKLRLSATNALPVALWSMRGSGSAWLRIVLELATGYSTGSTALDHEVSSAALRNGAWFNRTDCDMMILVGRCIRNMILLRVLPCGSYSDNLATDVTRGCKDDHV